MGAAPPEAKTIAPKSRVCGLKGIAACLAELAATETDRQLTFSRTTVKRHADNARAGGFGKPEPRAYQHALDALGVTSHDAWKLIHGAACVLLDLGLPDARGLQALRWLLQHYPESATVFTVIPRNSKLI